MKNDRRHDVPLARQAIAIINRVPRIGNKYTFTLNGTAATNNFKAKKRLNQLAGIEAWTSWHKSVAAFLDLPGEHMLFCGMALGYADETAPINRWRSSREGVDGFAVFKGFADHGSS